MEVECGITNLQRERGSNGVSLNWAWSQSHDLFKFWEIINDILQMVQYREIVAMED